MKIVTKIIFNSEEEKQKTLKDCCPDKFDKRYKSYCDEPVCGGNCGYISCEECWDGTDIELVVEA